MESNLFVLDKHGKATQEIEHFASWVFVTPAPAYRCYGDFIEYRLAYNLFDKPRWYRNEKKVKLKQEPELQLALKQHPINTLFNFDGSLWTGRWHVVNFNDEWRLVDPSLESVSNAPALFEPEFSIDDPKYVWEAFQHLFNYLPLDGIVYSKLKGHSASGPIWDKVYVYKHWFEIDVENVLF